MDLNQHKKALAIALAITLGACLGAIGAPRAPGQSAVERFNELQSQLDESEQREDVLTTTISDYGEKIDSLRSELAELRNKEATVQAQLDQLEAELAAAEAKLEELRARLKRAIEVLGERLVEIYKSNEPDVLTVILESDGFADLLEREDYLSRIQNMDSAVVSRVRDLRNQMQAIVEQTKAARDQVAVKRAELAETHEQLAARNAELAQARSQQRSALGSVRDQQEKLEGDLSEISKQVQEQLSGSSSPLPAGPIRGGSGRFIWPVDGPISSPFGWRWGRMHEGVDISVPSGTPIRAADAGSIEIAGPTGGYGNYTCLSHGGGLSTCYAHQSSFARTSGSLGQGDIVGYVGCTGHCFGDHLHFEVRINGQAVDPMGYL